jgi:carbonic anhydrase
MTEVPTSPVPRLGLVVVTCMDTRLDMKALGLAPGDAHILRNAGGFVSTDVLRSIAISQRFLQTTRILLVAHTDCGAMRVDQPEFTAGLAGETGEQPPWEVDIASSPEEMLATGTAAIADCPFLTHRTVETALYDVHTQQVHYYDAPPPATNPGSV